MTGLSHAPELTRSVGAPAKTKTPLQAPSGRVVTAGLLIFAAVWLLHLASTSLAPPVDNIEQLTWVRSLQWGYYKHPPFPTWLLWLPVQILGLSAWTASLLGALVTLGAMGILWSLLSELRGPKYAAIALMAALCITYYNGRLNYYNHNVVLLLAVVACASCCWHAVDKKSLRWWFALGVVMGLGALTKYQIAVTALSVLCFWISQRAWREPIHVRGLLLTALTALVIFTPHLLWLPAHDFGPIRYAMTTSLGVHLGAIDRLLNAGNWAADQLLNRSMPALILLGACAYSASRRRARRPLQAVPPPTLGAKPGSRALIFCWAVVPLLFMPAMGVIFGADLQLQWGTAFLPFFAPAAMELLPHESWMRVRMAFALKGFLVLQGILLVVSYVTSPMGVQILKDHHWRTFKSKTFADDVAAPARALLGGSVRVVIGAPAIAGALALQLPERPLVLIDGDFHNSPWVPIDMVSRWGALEIVRASSQPIDAAPVGMDFPKLYWRIIKPDRLAVPTTTAASRCGGNCPTHRTEHLKSRPS